METKGREMKEILQVQPLEDSKMENGMIRSVSFFFFSEYL